MKKLFPLSPRAKVRLMPNVQLQELDADLVLLDLNRETYFGLDEIGKQMLLHLEHSATIESAYQQLLTEFEVEPDQLWQDLQQFIKRMINHGLVAVTSAQMAVLATVG